jgi:hypothetical protein
MSKSRTNLSIRITATVFAFLIVMSASLTAGAIHFAVIGDRTGEHHPGIYREIVQEVARLHPDFVMNVGDMIEGYDEDSTTIHGEWQEYMSLLQPLSVPVHCTVGNHDIWSDMSERLYRHYIGEPYYSFNYENLHFVVLDNGRWDKSANLPKEEIDWLIDDLKTNQDAAYTFAFCHKPFWYGAVVNGVPDTVRNIMVNLGVDAVFSGHYHEYFSGDLDGIHYTGVGSSGADALVSPTGVLYHFVWVTVDDKGIHITPVKEGSVLPWEETTINDKMAFDKIKHFGIMTPTGLPLDDNFHVQKASVNLQVDNSYSNCPVQDTIRWTVPAGWSVEPSTLPVELDTGEVNDYTFTAVCDSNPFSPPVATLVFGYGDSARVESQCAMKVMRQAVATHAATAPNIDGSLSESYWTDPVSVLIGQDGHAATIGPTSFYFSYDDHNLYLGAVCHESQMDSIVANVTDRDGAIYGEDCVGYFIEPVPESDTAYQIYFNPQGAVFDQILTRDNEGWMSSDRSWDGVYDVKTSRGDGSWSIEVKIPLQQFGTIAKSGEQVRINFRRKQKHLNDAGDWQPIYGDPETYGLLLLK